MNDDLKELKDLKEVKKEPRPFSKQFDELVKEHNVQPAVAKALRTIVKVKSNGMVETADFVKALKQFSTLQPK
jgi:hypothetical protein